MLALFSSSRNTVLFNHSWPKTRNTVLFNHSCKTLAQEEPLTNVCVHTHFGGALCRFVAGESNRDSLGNSLDVILLNCVLEIIHGPMLAITYTSLGFRCLAQAQ